MKVKRTELHVAIEGGTDPIQVLMAMPEHFSALPERERGQR